MNIYFSIRLFLVFVKEVVPEVSAVLQLRLLVSVSYLELLFDLRSGQDLWWSEWHGGAFPTSTSVSSANSHPTSCSTFTNHTIIDNLQSRASKFRD
jgi:hypothetical protein